VTAPGLWAQAAALQKAVALAPATIYMSPDTSSAKVGVARPGMDVGIQSTSGDFIQVFTGVSGWMPNHDVVRLDDPQGDEVLFGAAVGLENLAEESGGERQAALDAARLYMALYSGFPASPRAAEAAYRGAEIRWEVALGEQPKRRTPDERQFPDQTELRRVESKFGTTPWGARAAYQLLITHFTCGDWVEKPQCVGKEIGTYKDYVKKYPTGPMTAEADYDAVYREAIAWTIYRAPGKNHDEGKAGGYAKDVAQDAAAMASKYRATDWAAQAALLAFSVAHNTPIAWPGTTPLGGP